MTTTTGSATVTDDGMRNDGRAPLSEVLGHMTWTHHNSAMVITFSRHHYANDSEPFGMMREFIGPDNVARRGFASWRDIEGARAEWRAMIERYTAKGWKRHETYPCGRCGKDLAGDVDAVRDGVCEYCKGEDALR